MLVQVNLALRSFSSTLSRPNELDRSFLDEFWSNLSATMTLRKPDTLYLSFYQECPSLVDNFHDQLWMDVATQILKCSTRRITHLSMYSKHRSKFYLCLVLRSVHH